MKNEKEKGNDYFTKETIQNARILFRFRAEIIYSKYNFKNNKEYKRSNYLCDSCEMETDENTHILHCFAYKDLRKDKDLQNDRDLAIYIQKVMIIRSKLRLSR